LNGTKIKIICDIRLTIRIGWAGGYKKRFSWIAPSLLLVQRAEAKANIRK